MAVENWHVSGTPEDIIADVREVRPEVDGVLKKVQRVVPYIKRQISEYQGAALYHLACDYNRDDARILDIGTAWGYSAACLAEGAPRASIVTLNQPKPAEYERAVKHLRRYSNVEALQMRSWDYLELSIASGDARAWDFIFVDGDHQQVERDFTFWEHVNLDGLMLYHDYSPDGTWRPCREVHDALDTWLAELGREEWDVLVVDDQGVGMAGLVKEADGA